MTHDDHAAFGINFTRRYRRYGHSRMHVLMPSRSRFGWGEALLLLAMGLIGGFGLGFAYAMLVLYNV